MRVLMPWLRRALWGVFVSALVLAPGVASAEPTDAADLDGDGRIDAVTLDRTQPFILHVWLTRTNTTAVIHTKRPIARVIAADLDGDRRPELIVRDIFSALHIWRQDTRNGFKPHAPKRNPQTTSRPASHTIDGGLPDSPEALPGFHSGSDLHAASTPSALVACCRPYRAVAVVVRLATPPGLASSFARPPPARRA
jgi:hypothetical protein